MDAHHRDNGSPMRASDQAPRRLSAHSAHSSDPPGSPQRNQLQPQRSRPGLYPVTSRPDLQPRPSAIRLRRLPSSPAVRLETIPSRRYEQQQQQQQQHPQLARQQELEEEWRANRRRSSSEPQRPTFTAADLGRAHAGGVTNMPSVPELPQNTEATNFEPVRPGPATGSGRFRRASVAALNGLRRNGGQPSQPSQPVPPENVYDSRIVDLLDVIDPEVSALSSLTNIQNSLFVPQLGKFVNRRPTYNLSRLPQWGGEAQQAPQHAPADEETVDAAAVSPPRRVRRVPAAEELRAESIDRPGTPSERAFSITSALSESRYAVLPHGISLEGWSEEDKAELNDYVRHMMHSRRSKFKRSLKGFGKYVSKPLGFLVTLYATLITLFGLAWVLFLIGWIYVGDRQHYIINVIDNVLVALFAIVGDGLAPFRAVDTYHMIFIAHYHHLTWSKRKKMQLPNLENKNDLPTEPATDADVETGRLEKEEMSVLTPKQQARLVHHQEKFSNSHTFYKPHETETHYAFPLRLLVAIVVLLDCHSLFQIALGACTWGISYHVRPQALTATILSCSITVNITAGIIISIGDRRTRKKDVIEKMFRQELTEEAMRKIQKRNEKHEERMREIDEAGEEGADEKKGRKSFALSRKSLDISRRSLNLPRKSEDKLRPSRKSEELPRRSLNLPRKSEDKPRQSLNLPRRSLNLPRTSEEQSQLSEARTRTEDTRGQGDLDITKAEGSRPS